MQQNQVSMRDRAQAFAEQEQKSRGSLRNDQVAPIEPFSEPTYGIVGTDVVRARYATNTPGMSPTIVCSDIRQGWTAPVSVSEVRLFDSLEQALFIRDQEQGIVGSTTYDQQTTRR